MTDTLIGLQARCAIWVQDTFGDKSLFDRRNRAARFAEEAVELAQAEGVDEQQMLKIVLRAYQRPVGEVEQEVAGSLFTFLVYCYAAGVWPAKAVHLCKLELDRCLTLGPEPFRAKQRDKFAAGTDLVEPYK